ncbi:hypothetical protein [Pandoraea sp. SD6-2]|uniref:hypothetical protein n=1 Tax=Pandoraea sp. SD6-2 TaxID=1286093 RepID=UPI00032E365C|nr:hypothetical protein [Pandoraea sp. SD6-2]EON15329.1 hypothetical protein C266_02551 [Pandoraea sp. SD6-2]
MDPQFQINPSDYGGSAGTGLFSIGPQNDGTYNYPDTAQPVNQPADVGAAATLPNYAPDVFKLLSQGLGALNSDYQMNQMLDYRKYEATQGGLYAQGQAAATVASAQIGAVNANKMLMILGLFAVMALAIHKG